MKHSISQPSLPTPLLLSDISGKMAKAGIRKTDTEGLYQALGGAMREVMTSQGLSIKEFACELAKDEAQIRRQMEGKDRPQIEVVFAVDQYRGPMVIALARLASGIQIDTVITVRRTA